MALHLPPLIKPATLLLFLACSLILSAAGTPQIAMEPDGIGAGMESEELLGLFEVVGSLLEDPMWAQLHPQPCTDTPWPGIQCELVRNQPPFLHVTKLHIGPDIATPPCKSSAHLSQSILKLPHLKILSLFNCFASPSQVSLSSSLFTNASSLEQLVMKFNPGLSGSIPPTIGQISSLKVLSLSQNNLHGEIPDELGGIESLKQLDLSYNKLTGKIPDEISGLTSLTIIDLSRNGLVGQVPSSLGQLQSLQKVDLSSNMLSGRIPSEMGKLEKLVLLDLSHNSLTGPIPESLSGMKELEYLLIENNPIGTNVPLFVGSLTKLAVLGFSGCGFLGPIPAYLTSLCNLTALSLDRNRLNGSVPTGLGALPKLGQLNLSQNQLSGEIGFSVEFVSRLGKRLDVRDNKGLCSNPQIYQNVSLTVLAPPPCLDSSAADSNSRPWAEEPGLDPGALKGSLSSRNGCEILISVLSLGVLVLLVGF